MALIKDSEGFPLADELRRVVGSFPYLESGVCGEFMLGMELGLSMHAEAGLLHRGFESDLGTAAPEVKRSTMSSRQKMASSLIAYSSPVDGIII